MTASKAIRIHCVECAGGTAGDAALCQIRDCPLWPFRLGCKTSSLTYKNRVRKTWERGGERVEEIRRMGLKIADFLLEERNKLSLAKNSAGPRVDLGSDLFS